MSQTNQTPSQSRKRLRVPSGLRQDLERLKQNDPTLTVFDLTARPIGTGGAVALGRRLRRNTMLRTLILRDHRVDKEGWEAIANGLRVNTSLQELTVELSELGNLGGAGALGQALVQNHTLRRLRLVSNLIGDECAIAIAEGLRANTSGLEILYLSGNRIGNAGAEALGQMLKVNRTLKELYLSQNQIGKEGAVAIAESLPENVGLENLNLFGNLIEREGAVALENALEYKNKTLKRLSVDHKYRQERAGIDYYCELNRIGRRFAVNVDLPWALWSHVLSRVSRKPNLLFWHVAAKPELFKRMEAPMIEDTDTAVAAVEGERKRPYVEISSAQEEKETSETGTSTTYDSSDARPPEPRQPKKQKTDTSTGPFSPHSRCAACWIPLRQGRRLLPGYDATKRQKENPFIQLWTVDFDAQSKTDSGENDDAIVLGRRQLLQTMRVACGCFSAKICNECQSVESWAIRHLSRQMLRIVPGDTTHQKILQLCGTNSPYLVKIDNRPVVVDSAPASSAQNNDGWRGRLPLNIGSLLTLGSPHQLQHQRDTATLTFELVILDLQSGQVVMERKQQAKASPESRGPNADFKPSASK